MPSRNRRLTILQIEDNEADVALTAYALKMSGVPHDVHAIADGREAIKFLHRAKGQKPAPRPDLILLDVSLPGADGHEVLRQIKQDASLKTIPVVMFSTLDTDDVRRRAYELRANSYVVKPQELATFVAAVQAIASYWSSTTALP